MMPPATMARLPDAQPLVVQTATPLQPDAVSPSWLTDVLYRTGRLAAGRVVTVGIESRNTSEAIVARVQPTYSPDAWPVAIAPLFFKASRADLTGNRQRGANEIRFYSGIGSEVERGCVAQCLDAVSSSDDAAYHLLLEDLSSTHFKSEWPLPPSNAECDAIIDCLAAIHATWWDDPRLPLIARLPSDASVRGSARWIEKTLPRFFDAIGDRLAPARCAVYETLLDAYVGHATRLTSRRNLTVVHGDAHAWNFLLPKDPGRDSVRLIDWAAWHAEMGLMDIAYLIAVHWYPERRARLEEPLLRRYHRRLEERGVRDYEWDDCWSDYRYCVFRSPLVPLWQWSAGLPAALWWAHLERSLAAFERLGCAELKGP